MSAQKKKSPFEGYREDDQLRFKGNYSMAEKCGEWIENGEATTYPPC